MIRFRFCVCCLTVVILLGCAGKELHVPEHAITDPAKGISVLHPVELEKQGIEVITAFEMIMSEELLTEMMFLGGVWPLLVQTSYGEIIAGYAYLSGVSYWGDFYLQAVILGHGLEKLKNSKSLYFNRDGGFAYSLSGDRIEYDPKKFDSDKEYRKKIFDQFGMSFKELDMFWIKYFQDKGLDLPSDFSVVREIVIKSDEWNSFKKKISSIMQHNYKMGNGEIRCGYLPLEYFRQEAVEIPGFNMKERYLKRASVPLITLPFSGGLLVTAGASITKDVIAAKMDDSWKGSYARAETIRYKMAPLFKQICLIYKDLLKKRDQRIRDLEFKLNSSN